MRRQVNCTRPAPPPPRVSFPGLATSVAGKRKSERRADITTTAAAAESTGSPGCPDGLRSPRLSSAVAAAAAKVFAGSNYPPQPKSYPGSADITHKRGSKQPMATSREGIMQMSRAGRGRGDGRGLALEKTRPLRKSREFPSSGRALAGWRVCPPLAFIHFPGGRTSWPL